MKYSKNLKKSVSLKKQTFDIASEVNYFTQNEIQSFLSVLNNAENRLMFMIGLELGARVSEVAGLRWDNINWTNKYITVWDEKKNLWRTCTISRETWDMLKERKKLVDARKDKLVFTYSTKTFNRYFKAWAAAAGVSRTRVLPKSGKQVDGIRWHMLRHTYVVQSIRAGREWNEIAQQTGDTLGTLVHTYGHLSIEDRVESTDNKPLIRANELR